MKEVKPYAGRLESSLTQAQKPSIGRDENAALRASFGMLVILLAMTASLSARATGSEAVGGTASQQSNPPQQIVVTFALDPAESGPAPQKNAEGGAHFEPATVRLAERYGMTPIKEWPIAVLGRQCVIFQNSSGLAIGPLIERLNKDGQISSAQVLNQFYATVSQ